MPDPRRSVAALAALVLLLAAPATAAGQDAATRLHRELAGVDRADVAVRYSAGRFSLSGTGTTRLYDARLRYPAGRFEPLHETEDGRVLLGLRHTRGWGSLRGGSPQGAMELILSNRVPLSLAVDLAAAQGAIDLGGLRLESLTLNLAASETALRVSSPNPGQLAEARFQTAAVSGQLRELGRLNAGEILVRGAASSLLVELGPLLRPVTRLRVELAAGRVEIVVPEGVAVRLVQRTVLSSVEAPGLEGGGGIRTSPEWGSAPQTVEIELDLALSSATIRRARP